MQLTVEELVHREEIRDCLARYARGVDRLDEALVLSAFHPDAVDCHGVVTQSPQAFVAWWFPTQGGREATQHLIANCTIDLTSERDAHVETYFVVLVKDRDSPDAQLFHGRYVDRFERRDGEWRIATRVVVADGHLVADGTRLGEAVSAFHAGIRGPADPSYERPLLVRQPVTRET